ncbi:hypothetical protein [Streptomyces sclerotialus]|uniref:hypothetical protein n=1 Tax=Streptomyces sclerotialus TaxID=1957 RepID=UPI0004CC87BE
MFVQPPEAGLDEAEWQAWIADGHDSGQLTVNGLPGHPPTDGRMLPGSRGPCLEVTGAVAKFTYDDHEPVEHRTTAADHLTARGQGLDVPTARRQHRRPDRTGPWKS